MKTLKLNILIAVSLLIAMPSLAERISKETYESYSIDQVNKLKVSNKYGNIYINDSRTDSVVIRVEKWIEGLSEKKALHLLDQIDISLKFTNGAITAQTNIKKNFKTRQKFSIDYYISIPEDKDLFVEQKYGGVNMNNLTGNGHFIIKYGHFNGKELNSAKLQMDIGFSEVSIDEVSTLNLVLRYSKMSIEKGKNLTIESRFSTLNIEKCNGLISNSRYDGINIGTIQELTMKSKFTNTDIDNVTQNFTLDNEYGNVSVGKISLGFKNINIQNRYANVSLKIDSMASYHLEAYLEHCSLKYFQKNTTTDSTVNEYVGNIKTTPFKVHIQSRYGNIDLTP